MEREIVGRRWGGMVGERRIRRRLLQVKEKAKRTAMHVHANGRKKTEEGAGWQHLNETFLTSLLELQQDSANEPAPKALCPAS